LTFYWGEGDPLCYWLFITILAISCLLFIIIGRQNLLFNLYIIILYNLYYRSDELVYGWNRLYTSLYCNSSK
jgi:hypothetical protein